MLRRISKREFQRTLEQDFTPEQVQAIEEKIASDPESYNIDNLYITGGYLAVLSQYNNVHQEIIYGG